MGYWGGFLTPWFQDRPNDRAMRNMVRVGVTYASEIAAERTPEATGDLKRAWKTGRAFRTMSFMGYAWQASWENDLDYAEFVNYGTGLYGPEHRKYLIVPKKPGGTLHWVDRVTGEDVFAKHVLHPGSPGHHMLEISANALEATWQRLVRPVLRNWAREVERQNPMAKIT